MKTLQRNFTTPEQSKRLLELGVPADSADCYYTWKLDHTAKINVLDNEIYSELLDHISQITVPCWSVGRLIEIHRICSTLPDEEYMFPFWKDQEYNVEWAIRVLESGIRTGNIDFSKLEE